MPTDVANKHEPVIERSSTAIAVPSSEQILTVIEQLHACYDYCAVWKQAAEQDDRADDCD